MGGYEVRLVRDFYDAVNRRAMADAMAAVHPAFEWVPSEVDLEREPHTGRDAARAALEALIDMLPNLEIEVEETEPVGPHVVTCVRHHARGRGSDAEITRREVHVWTFRNGVATRLAEFPTREAALDALSARR